MRVWTHDGAVGTVRAAWSRFWSTPPGWVLFAVGVCACAALMWLDTFPVGVDLDLWLAVMCTLAVVGLAWIIRLAGYSGSYGDTAGRQWAKTAAVPILFGIVASVVVSVDMFEVRWHFVEGSFEQAALEMLGDETKVQCPGVVGGFRCSQQWERNGSVYFDLDDGIRATGFVFRPNLEADRTIYTHIEGDWYRFRIPNYGDEPRKP
ncbi:hypothetical protein JGU71_17635 [Antrihabitans sp. YC3-6]|uniref:Uncharacterized protein n=1 Tax=Antrihabitans stalagmiti TaxID=2799499 RepID=A0A934NT27_9NOCA|nr:hypothetical protein [Antrihabitans stalagmiti]MBJ8340717.1 hypothetical protein [Antrihabitans stalagmiti]